MHRVVQSANAMLSRALFLLGDGNKPKPADLVGLKRDDYALHGEDIFFQSVIERCTKPINNIQAQRLANGEVKTRRYIDEARRIFLKLIDRCVYRSLMIIPGDRAAQHFRFGVWPKKDDRGETEYDLRTLATIIDSAYYSSFFLFVSACVEKFLQEIFDTDDALCGHAQKIGDNNTPSALVEQAMQIVPSRVIIWTTPYKQLYKDPAVVVALDGWNGRIDDFVNNYSSTSTHNTSACNLVEASIQDADSKYAALWKLYVFISDGLFYTGILNKLKNCLDAKESEEDSVKRHELRLKRAQAFLIAAFEAVYEDWRNFCGTHNSVDDQRKHLEGSMSQERFKNLVCSWTLTYQKAQLQENDPTSELSTVDVGHYAHGDPLQGDAGHNCRDIRYKMDRPAGDVWNRAKKKDAKSSEYKLVTFLEQVGVQNPNTISQEEFKQLAGLYDDEETRARCQEWLQKVPADLNPEASGSLNLKVSALKELWLAGFPWPYERSAPKSREQTEPPVETPPSESRSQLALQSHREIKDWLLKEAKVLEPLVRKQFTTDLDPLVEYIESKLPEQRSEVFAKIRLLLSKESEVIGNHILIGQIINTLRAMEQQNNPSNSESSELD